MRAATMALLLACTGAWAGERTFHYARPAQGVEKVSLEVPVGDVHVASCQCETLSVTVEVEGSQRKLEQLELQAQLREGILRLSLERGPESMKGKGFEENWQLLLPHTLPLQLEVGVGDVQVLERQGAVELELGVGDVRLTGCQGDLEVEVGVGDVDIAAPKEAVGRVFLAAGVGEVSLRTGEKEKLGSGFLGGTLAWVGEGTARLEVKAGVGDVRVRLR